MNNTVEIDNKKLYSCMEAAIQLGIHYGSIMLYKRKGMPHVNRGGRAYFDVEVCRAWLAERKDNMRKRRVEAAKNARMGRNVKLNEGDIVQDKSGKFCVIVETDGSGKMFAVKYLNATGVFYMQRKNITLYARKVKGGEA